MTKYPEAFTKKLIAWGGEAIAEALQNPEFDLETHLSRNADALLDPIAIRAALKGEDYTENLARRLQTVTPAQEHYANVMARVDRAAEAALLLEELTSIQLAMMCKQDPNYIVRPLPQPRSVTLTG